MCWARGLLVLLLLPKAGLRTCGAPVPRSGRNAIGNKDGNKRPRVSLSCGVVVIHKERKRPLWLCTQSRWGYSARSASSERERSEPLPRSGDPILRLFGVNGVKIGQFHQEVTTIETIIIQQQRQAPHSSKHRQKRHKKAGESS